MINDRRNDQHLRSNRSKSSRFRDVFNHLRRNSSSSSVSRVTELKKESCSVVKSEDKTEKRLKRSQSAPPNANKTRVAKNEKLFHKVETPPRKLVKPKITEAEIRELEEILGRIQ